MDLSSPGITTNPCKDSIEMDSMFPFLTWLTDMQSCPHSDGPWCLWTDVEEYRSYFKKISKNWKLENFPPIFLLSLSIYNHVWASQMQRGTKQYSHPFGGIRSKGHKSYCQSLIPNYILESSSSQINFLRFKTMVYSKK